MSTGSYTNCNCPTCLVLPHHRSRLYVRSFDDRPPNLRFVPGWRLHNAYAAVGGVYLYALVWRESHRRHVRAADRLDFVHRLELLFVQQLDQPISSQQA